jgi:hypothetical protein
MREELLQRGWIEHDKPGEDEKFLSKAFHLMYAVKNKDCYRLPDRAL